MTASLPQSVLPLIGGVWLEQCEQHSHLRFAESRPVLSSAVLNGGMTECDHFLNLKVDASCPLLTEEPALTLARHAEQHGWSGKTVGMMTAASMKSLRVEQQCLEGVELAVLVTTGVANARRAGDDAEYRQLESRPAKVGTINTAIVINAPVAPEALVEIVTLATEAKAAILQTLDITSPVSGDIATGTGTDAIAVIGSHQGDTHIRFAGKHTLLGEQLARMLMSALRSSINYQEGEQCGA